VAPPLAVTKPATAASVTGATLNATVTPNSGGASPTQVIFQYGKTTAYGSKTAVQTVEGVSPLAVSMTITVMNKDAAGDNRVSFSGRIRGRALAPGSYLLELTPRAGRFVGKTVTVAFTIRK
jgi:hypothetical protein